MVHSKRSEIKNGSLRPFGPFQHIDTGYFKVERFRKVCNKLILILERLE
jgi:hypothetical protein